MQQRWRSGAQPWSRQNVILGALAAAVVLIRSLGLWDRRGTIPAASTKSGLPAVGVDPRQPGASYDFSILIVSYHKTGHDLQMDLVDYMVNEFPGIGPQLTEYGNKSLLKRRRHPPKTPCARIHLQTGTISVQHAPDLFCKPEDLARILLEGGHGHREFDRGVKIVHLVRNPFEMAVSNYHYHARVPTPEAWVTTQNPCDIQYAERGIDDSYADMVLPSLSKTRYESMDINFGREQLVSRDEFDGIVGDCLSLYQTREGMEHANLLSHLIKYDAPEGLRLATAEMMVQGHDNGGDILRMANNVVKFKQTQVKVAHSPTYREMNRELQIYTMSLDDFIARPAMSALRFFDFVLDRTNISPQRKEEAAMKYERYYREKIKGSRHVTHGKSRNSDQLKEYLRRDAVFGPPLRKIELLVEAALANARNGLTI